MRGVRAAGLRVRLSGQFYKQFAVTIAISTVISAFNSLTLSPALAALLLRSHAAPPDRFQRLIDRTLGGLFRPFNRGFDRASAGYGRATAGVLRHKALAFAGYAALVALTVVMFRQVPAGFVPTQDKQYLVAFASLPDGASLQRTEAVVREIADTALKVPGVMNAIAFPGLSISGFTLAPNAGVLFIGLDDFERRTTPELSGAAIAGRINHDVAAIKGAFIAAFPPPAVSGLGTVGGFKLQLQDRESRGFDALNQALGAVLSQARQTPELAGVFSSYQINVPQLYADIDRTKAKQLGVNLRHIYDSLQANLGSLYVNDFNRFGRTYQVIVQADAPFRRGPESIAQLKVRGREDAMIPLGSLLSVTPSFGPDRVSRYNAFYAADVNGAAGPGFSSGEAQAAMEKILHDTLPPGFSHEWTDLVYQEKIAGNTLLVIFPLCVLLVFLVLAAQYESWTLPLAVILIVPMCILCAVTGIWLTDGDNNIFTQIAFIVLVGLACKNAILIVEFAVDLERQGMETVAATIQACQLRLRPILMTSIAFIAGVVPLLLARGAGAEMRRAMGVAVFSGMLGVTLFGLFLTPVFYVALRKLSLRRGATQPQAEVEHA